MAISESTDRFNGVLSTLAIKAPCKAVAIANITLSGEQTVNGVAVSLGRPETLADDLVDEHERSRFLAEAERVRRAGKTAAGLLAGQRGAILAFEDTPRPAAYFN